VHYGDCKAREQRGRWRFVSDRKVSGRKVEIDADRFFVIVRCHGAREQLLRKDGHTLVKKADSATKSF
jgi:hypothetical protein